MVAREHVDRVGVLEEIIAHEFLSRGIGRLDIRVIKDRDELVDYVLGVALLQTRVLWALDFARSATGIGRGTRIGIRRRCPVHPAGCCCDC